MCILWVRVSSRTCLVVRFFIKFDVKLFLFSLFLFKVTIFRKFVPVYSRVNTQVSICLAVAFFSFFSLEFDSS